MGFPLTLALRAVQGVVAFVILGLAAYGMRILRENYGHRSGLRIRLTREIVVANWYNVDTLTSSPSQINFMIFVPLFTLISVAYLEVVPKLLPKCKHLVRLRERAFMRTSSGLEVTF